MPEWLKNNKILRVALFLSAAIFFGFLIYYFFFRPLGQEPAPSPTGTNTPTGRLPDSDQGTPRATSTETGYGHLQPGEEQLLTPADAVAHGGITQVEAISAANGMGQKLSSDGQSVEFYNKDDGRFYRIDQNGNPALLSDKVFHEVQNIYWDPAGDKAILKYPDGANILYNFKTESQATLPSHWKDYNFDPSGNQIVMKSVGLDVDNRYLAVSSPDGSSARAIEPIGEFDDTVYPSWSPNQQSIAMFTQSTGVDQQQLFFVGLNKENFKSMTIEGRGFEYLWSPKGDRLLYSVYSLNTDLKPTLWTANAQGDAIGTGRKNLTVQTWANKCVFSDNETVYCAVPEQLDEGVGIYPDMAEASPDQLYKINIYTGFRQLVAIPENRVAMHNLIVSSNGRYLYFSDKDGKIYKIQLK